MAPDPKIIAIETTTRRGGIALAEGPKVIASQMLALDRDYAADLLPAVDALCRQAGWSPDRIEQIHVSIGPGSFTGTRIGATFAKTLALAVSAKVVAVPTFEAIALNALDLDDPPANLAVLMDARGGQVFAEVFHLSDRDTGGAAGQETDRSYVLTRSGELIALSALLADLPHPIAFIGEGVAPHEPALRAAGGTPLPDDLAAARVETVHRVGWRMARRGQFSEVDTVVPVYYRLPTPVERLQAIQNGR